MAYATEDPRKAVVWEEWGWGGGSIRQLCTEATLATPGVDKNAVFERGTVFSAVFGGLLASDAFWPTWHCMVASLQAPGPNIHLFLALEVFLGPGPSIDLLPGGLFFHNGPRHLLSLPFGESSNT